jgi:hypothetical protein
MNTEQNTPTPKKPFDYEAFSKTISWICAGIGAIIAIVCQVGYRGGAISAGVSTGKLAALGGLLGYILGWIIGAVVRHFKEDRTKTPFRDRTTEDKAKIILIWIIVILGTTFLIWFAWINYDDYKHGIL